MLKPVKKNEVSMSTLIFYNRGLIYTNTNCTEYFQNLEKIVIHKDYTGNSNTALHGTFYFRSIWNNNLIALPWIIKFQKVINIVESSECIKLLNLMLLCFSVPRFSLWVKMCNKPDDNKCSKSDANIISDKSDCSVASSSVTVQSSHQKKLNSMFLTGRQKAVDDYITLSWKVQVKINMYDRRTKKTQQWTYKDKNEEYEAKKKLKKLQPEEMCMTRKDNAKERITKEK